MGVFFTLISSANFLHVHSTKHIWCVTLPDSIYLWLRNEVSRFIEGWAITHRAAMPVMKVTICCDMNITAFVQWSPEQGAAEACWTALDKYFSTRTLGEELLLQNGG